MEDTLPPLPALGEYIPARYKFKQQNNSPNVYSEPEFKFRNPPIQKSIREWSKYIDFIERQVADKVKDNSNIPSLSCGYNRDKPGKITYTKSKYDDYMLGEILVQYAKPMRTEYSKESLTNYPSFLRVFKDGNVTFWPHVLVYYNSNATLKHFPKDTNATLKSAEFADELYDGAHDAILQDVFERDPAILRAAEVYANEFRAILSAAEKKPVAISSFVSEIGRFHGTAGIVYKSHGKFFYGIYDPMFYVRKDANYVWPVISTYLAVKAVGALLGVDITLLNLCGFCLKGPKGTHCPQYIIDANYCPYYSAYFLYLWAAAGAPKSVAGLRRIVEEAFIVSPADLRRDPCVASKRFRLVSIGFILSILTLTIETPAYLVDVSNLVSSIGVDGFNVIHPDLQGLLPGPSGGGRLRGRIRNRRTRRLRR